MPQLLDLLVITPTIGALYKPFLAGAGQVSNLSDRVIVGFLARDWLFAAYGRRPRETFDFLKAPPIPGAAGRPGAVRGEPNGIHR